MWPQNVLSNKYSYQYGVRNSFLEKYDNILQFSIVDNFSFFKDPFTQTCAYLRICTSAWRFCLHLVCASFCRDLYQISIGGLIYLSFKFHKDGSFRYRYIWKTIVICSSLIVLYHSYFQNLSIKVTSKFEKYNDTLWCV